MSQVPVPLFPADFRVGRDRACDLDWLRASGITSLSLPRLCALVHILCLRYTGQSKLRYGLLSAEGLREWVLTDAGDSFPTLLAQVNEALAKSLPVNMPSGDEVPYGWVVVTDETPAAAYGDLCLYAQGKLGFQKDRFSRQRAESFADHLMTLMARAEETPHLPVHAWDFLAPGQRQRLVVDLNATTFPVDHDMTVLTLFHQQASRSPDAVAIDFHGTRLTYGELEARANRFAHYLRQNFSAGPEQIVGLLLQTEAHMPVALLGVLKTGAAYLPLDPQLPTDRAQFMVAQAQCPLVVTSPELASTWQGPVPAVPYMDHPEYSEALPEVDHHSDQLMYVIFTSGSTGVPKGVMIEHRPFWNLMADILYNADGDLTITPEDRVAQFASLSFDVSIAEIFMTLLSGAQLYLIKPEVKFDGLALITHLAENAISIATLPPAYLGVLPREMINVRVLITGGDVARPEDVRYYSNKCAYINSYGPTEATVGVSYFRVTPDADIRRTVPIGKPIANTQIYLLDQHQQLVPEGCVGEIAIGGDCLARGYLGDPELTQQKFVPNPFAAGTKLYLTGDLGRWTPEGNIDFLGRRDEQVKVRGYRIECGEIETHLMEHPEVAEAVVLARPDSKGQKSLAAFYVGSADAAGLPAFLAPRLPHYMLPDICIALPGLPLNANGKIDRKQLAEMPLAEADLQSDTVDDPTQAQLCAFLSEILETPVTDVGANIFELGLDSLKATRFTAAILAQSGHKLSLQTVFQQPTVQALATVLDETDADTDTVIARVPDAPSFPLSHAQRRLWILHALGEQQGAYNMTGTYVFRGSFSPLLLEQAFAAVARRHQTLRTRFVQQDGAPVQIVEEQAALELRVLDLLNRGDGWDRARAFAQEDGRRVFDLASAPLLRALLVRVTPHCALFQFTQHHIVSDGWSMVVLAQELVQAYAQLARGYEPEFAPLPIQYRDYSAWQNQRLADNRCEGERAHWQQALAGPLPILHLPTDFPRPATKSYEGRMITRHLSPELHQQALDLAHSQGASLYMVLLAAVHALLARISDQTDLVTGSIVAGRERKELAQQIGFFVNILAVRNPLDLDDSFTALLEQIQEKVLAAYAHQDYPFDQVVADLDLPRDPSRNPITDIMVVLQDKDFDIHQVQGIEGLQIQALPPQVTSSKFDLSFVFAETAEGFLLNLHYSTDLFRADLVERFCDALQFMLEAALNQPDMALARLPILHDAQRSALLQMPKPAHRPDLMDLWQHHAQATPDAVVLEDAHGVYSFKQVDTQVQQLAALIVAHAEDQPVALICGRNAGYGIAVLAALRAHHTFVPIEPKWPQARIQQLLADSNCACVISDLTVTSWTLPTLNLHHLPSAAAHAAMPARSVPAYILYTSGSTGKPKGVCVSRRNLGHTLGAAIEAFDMNQQTAMPVVASFAFDISLFECFAPVFAGGRAVIAEIEDLLNAERLIALMQRINTLHAVPAVMRQVLDALATQPQASRLTQLFTGGDLVPLDLPRLASQVLPQARMTILYGPTEGTIICSYHHCDGTEQDHVIGKPLPRTGLYVLDAYLNPRPDGVPGELCIAGHGVSAGYLDDPERTNQKFPDHPLDGDQRIYRTGDRVLLRADGNLVFRGRTDFQIKLRGYRIEPEEIGALILTFDEVEEVVVCLKGEPPQLVAYIVGTASQQQIQAHLQKHLPAYMVPEHYVFLESLPQTANHKVDQAALPDPMDAVTARQYVAPRNPTETLLLQVWQEVLGRERLGVEDDFFAQGGDSIKAIQIASRAHSAGLFVDMKDIFAQCTVSRLAQVARSLAREVEQGPVTGTFPLLPQWAHYFDQPEIYDHKVLCLRLEEETEPEVIEAVLCRLQQQHDGLRLTFPIVDDTPQAQIMGLDFPMDLTFKEEDEVQWDTITCDLPNFDMAKGPLIRAIHLRESADYLILALHHLVADGLSRQIILEDLDNMLMQGSNDPDLFDLPPKTEDLPRVARQLSVMPAQKSPPLQRDAQPQATQVWQGKLDADTTAFLMRKANEAYRTLPQELMLASIAHAFGPVSDSPVVVALEVSERVLGLDVSRTVGQLAYLHAIPLPFHEDLGDQIICVKEACRQLPQPDTLPTLRFRFTDVAPETFAVQPLMASAGFPMEFWASMTDECLQLTARLPNHTGFVKAAEQCLATFKTIATQIATRKPRATPSDFTYPWLSQAEVDLLCKPLIPVDIYALSPLQEGMLSTALRHPDGGAYLEQVSYTWEGVLEPPLVKAALAELCALHPILRTRFHHVHLSRPMQVVLPMGKLPFTFHDLSQHEDPHAFMAETQAPQPFRLDRDPLLRLHLFQLASDRFRFHWCHHHILMDGWCLGLLARDFNQIYQSLVAGKRHELAEPPAYATYIHWLSQQNREASLNWWQNYLQDFQHPTPLTTTQPKTGANTTHQWVLPEALSSRLTTFATQHQLTLNNLFQVAWGVLLARYNQRQEAVFGAVVSGRPAQLAEMESCVGLFINTIPMRVLCQPSTQLVALATQLRDGILTSEPHHYLPLPDVCAVSEPGAHLIDHIMVFANYPLHLQQESISEVQVLEKTEYPFDITIDPRDQICISFNYHKETWTPAFIQRMAGHLEHLLSQWGQVTQVGELELMDAGDRAQLLQQSDVGTHSIPPQTLHQRILCAAHQWPNRIALRHGTQTLTFTQLVHEVTQLADDLQSRGAGMETPIALIAERGIPMVVHTLAILAAGAVFLPIDPAMPQRRKEHILAECCPALTLEVGSQAHYPVVNTMPQVSPQSLPLSALAYILFTSGSTGKPKGTLVSHLGLSSITETWAQIYQLPQRQLRFMQLASFSFDVYMADICRTLPFGGELVICPAETRTDMPALTNLLTTAQIQAFDTTPALAMVLLDHLETQRQQLPDLEMLILGADTFYSSDYARLRAYFPAKTQILNTYGTTETTVESTNHTPGQTPKQPIVPLGSPLPNQPCYVLDPQLRPQPPGVEGELFIGGQGLARGYLGLGATTAWRFLPNPLGDGRLYRTGDRVMMLEEGHLAFLGRNDGQIQIRGLRVEVGEIEACLRNQEDLDEAAVLVHQGTNGLVLYAFCTGTARDTETLRHQLALHLPEHMIPSRFQWLESLPLNANGKIDRKRLQVDPSDTVAEPLQTPMEQKLATIWQELLHVDIITRETSFFELGGHSLSITRLHSRIGSQLRLEVPLARLFETPRLRDMATLLEQANRAGAVDIKPLPVADHYAVSHGQRRIWIQEQAQASGMYNMTGFFRLTGPLDAQAVCTAFSQTVMRHHSLRTIFREVEGHVRAFVQEPGFTPCTFQDIRHDPTLAEALMMAERRHRFALDRGPLLRATLLQTHDTQHLLLVNMHHIISDGWSVDVLVREITARMRGQSFQRLPLQYQDYAAWQLAQIQESWQHHGQWWQARFAQLPAPLSLPTDRPRPPVFTHKGIDHRLTLPLDILPALENLGQQHGCTLFMTLTVLVKTLLFRLTGQRDLVVGTPVAGRPHPDLEPQIGFYVNTLPLRTQFEPDTSFAQLLEAVRHTALSSFEQQHWPFDLLVEHLDLTPDPSRHPLFDVMVQVEEDEQPGQHGFHLEPVDEDMPIALFDLSFTFLRRGQNLDLHIDACSDLFRPATLERFGNLLRHLAQEAISDPNHSLFQLSLLDEKEQHRVLHQFNAQTPPLVPMPVPAQLLAAQIQAHPQAPALHTEQVTWTYVQLMAQVCATAEKLRKAGLQPGQVVALTSGRSAQMVAAIYAIWSLGACWVPLAPEDPPAHNSSICEDSTASLAVGEDAAPPWLPSFVSWVPLTQGSAPTQSFTTHPPEQPAYVLYTSGTTGKPKGVVVPQAALAHRLGWFPQRYQLDEDDVAIHRTPLTFDVAVCELIRWLPGGGALAILPHGDERDPARILETIARHQVTVIDFTPSQLDLFLDLAENQTDGLSSLRWLIGGAEAIPPSQVHRVQQLLKTCVFTNGYGPTETCVDVTAHDCTDLSTHATTVPLGGPVAGTRFYVLDRWSQPVPVGVRGELCIGGGCVAQGYLHQPALTAQSFVPAPDGGRIYRTGDLVAWQEDGTLLFYGRNDQQLKVRGKRVEIGEIQARLASHPQVNSVAILVRPMGGEPMLVAYITITEPVEVPTLKLWLGERLPAHMVPAHILILPSLPMTRNGKLDTDKLPEPAPDSHRPTYEAPRTEQERQLCELWSQVLGVPSVGVTDDFFQLGGHSLKAARLTTAISRKLGCSLQLRQIFEHPILADQAELLGQQTHQPITPIALAPDYPLSHGQQRLWLLDRMENTGSAYHMPATCIVTGSLDTTAVAQALKAVVARHESLRTRFVTMNNAPRQMIDAQPNITPQFLDLRAETAPEERAATLAQAQHAAPFALDHGPLLRLSFYQLAEERWLLAMTLHHIISDGLSMKVLVRELFEAYAAFRKGEAPSWLALSIQYKDYTVWLQHWLQSEAAQEAKAYWQQQLTPLPPVWEPPTDFPRGARMSYVGSNLQHRFPAQFCSDLRSLGLRHQCSLFMVLVAAFRALSYRTTHTHDLLIGSPVTGREHPDLDHQIGIYINMLALRTRLQPQAGFGQLLGDVRTHALAAYTHQRYPFDKVVDDLSISRDPSRGPLFDMMLGMLDAEPLQGVEGLQLHDFKVPIAASVVDLSLSFEEGPDYLDLSITYNTDLFLPRTIERLYLLFGQMCHALIAQPDTPLERLDWLAEAEKSKLLQSWGCGPGLAEATQTLVEAVAARGDDPNTALIYEDGAHSYGDLQIQTQALAASLITRVGLQPGDAVAVLLPRGPQVVIAMLAIWHCGAIYVPLDPDHPQQRLRFQMEDSTCICCITQPALSQAFPDLPQPIHLDNLPPCVPQPARTQPHAVAYRIYTSGSTGTPKGVCVTHVQLMHTLSAAVAAFGFEEGLTMPLLAPFVFDISFFELGLPLLLGGSCTIVTKDKLLDMDYLCELLEDMTALHAVPALMGIMVEAVSEANTDTDQLGWLFTGGDRVPAQLLQRLEETFSDSHIHVLYGPTEATLICAAHAHEPDHTVEGAVGQPLPRNQLLVMDPRGQLLPHGYTGELYIGGPGLASFYHNQPGLTASRYVPHPFAHGQRLYRSGDLSRWICDEQGHYLRFEGRTDVQLKVRGFRVDPGEVEAQARALDGISEAVVRMAGEGNQTQLALWYTGQTWSNAQLRKALGKRVPDYMVPTHLQHMDALPLTPNGKVNRQALRMEKAPRPNTSSTPVSAVAQKLLTAWQQVLGRDDLTIDDDFFTHGGDSIKAIRIVALLGKQGFSLSIGDLLAHPKVRDLTDLVHEAQSVTEDPTGRFPLSPTQQQWFARGSTGHRFHYAVLLHAPDRLDATDLDRSVVHLLDHHDALRARFPKEEGQRWMDIPPTINPIIHRKTLTKDGLNDAVEAVHDSLNPETGPALAVGHFHLPDGDRLLIVGHHLVLDIVSWQRVLENLATLYAQAQTQAGLDVGPKSRALKTWHQAVAHYAQGESCTAHLPYWQAVVDAIPETPPHGTTWADNYRLNTQLTPEVTTALRLSEQPAQVILLHALATAWGEVTSYGKLVVTLEDHGRRGVFGDFDVSRTVGWFTILYPLALQTDSSLQETAATLASVPNHGMDYGLLLAQDVLPQRQSDLSFNYQGSSDNPGPLLPAQESAGAEMGTHLPRMHTLDAGAAIIDGQLQLTLDVAARHWPDGLMEALLDSWEGYTCSLLAEAQAAWVPASPGQLRLYEESHLQEERDAGRIQGAFHLHGPLDLARLQQALDTALIHHDALDLIAVHRESTLGFQRLGLTGFPLTQTQGNPQTLVPQWLEANQLDPHQGPLVQGLLVQVNPQHHVLVILLSHLIADGVSVGLLLRHLIYTYTGNQPAPQPDTFGNYLRQLPQTMTTEPLQTQRNYWQNQTYTDPCFPQWQGPTRDGRWHTLELGDPQPLITMARATGISLMAPLLLLTSRTLAVLTDRNPCTLGIGVAGRTAQWQTQVGFWANTLPLHLDQNHSLAQVGQNLQTALDHQSWPYEQLCAEMGKQLFDVRVALQQSADAGQSGETVMGDVTLKPFPLETPQQGKDIVRHALELTFSVAHQLELHLHYPAYLFDAAAITQLESTLRYQLARLLEEHPCP